MGKLFRKEGRKQTASVKILSVVFGASPLILQNQRTILSHVAFKDGQKTLF